MRNIGSITACRGLISLFTSSVLYLLRARLRLSQHRAFVRNFAFLAACILCPGAFAWGADPAKVDFNRVIRPILSTTCFKCHGPDLAERKGGLRLDERDGALQKLESGAVAIVPGNLEQSELIRRILSTDNNERMPPPDSQRQLTDQEKESLKLWVSQGAEYRQHWSFRPVSKPERPTVKYRVWGRNAIDDFILARLEAEGLKPSVEADKATLIRRVTLDLTGLPPTPKEIDAFVADTSLDAYEKLIDRLMGTSAFAERMALEWLDVARYADTNGYHIDNGRDMTPWRDWVIEAFAKNMPYDQFTIEQLAGDLLPNATLSQQIASGFNRNHMINFEGGAIPEEYHNAYIVDRVNTTGTVFLGLTVGCAQCHDHKYDPITQKEYYQLYSFFYNVPENGLDGRTGNASPLIKAPTAEQADVLAKLKRRVTELEEANLIRKEDQKGGNSELSHWINQYAESVPTKWLPLSNVSVTSQGNASVTQEADGTILFGGPNAAKDEYAITGDLGDVNRVTAIQLEVLPHESFPAMGPGRSNNGNFVLTNVEVSLENGTRRGMLLSSYLRGPGSVKLERNERWYNQIFKATADFSQDQFPIANAIDDDPKSGWAIFPEVNKPHTAIFELNDPIESSGITPLSQRRGGSPVLGRHTRITIKLSFQSQFAQHQAGRIRISVTNSLFPHGKNSLPENITQILAVPRKAQTPEQRTALEAYYESNVSPIGRFIKSQTEPQRKKIEEFEKTVRTAMVMQEMQQPRQTFILMRGQYDKKGEQVQPGVPSILPPLPDGMAANRLALAEWLVAPEHPLMSRVTVNRYWQMLFGTGLVKTADDFGSQGEQASHPELLDWLAFEFKHPNVASGRAWDVRQLLKLILLSSTYRQQSYVSKSLLEKDPENRLLARGSRHRLQIEMIRDQALFVSGLLDRRIGGASVSPYQPAGLWEELMSRADGKNWTAQEYTQSHGPDLYRRTMYTFWKRTCPPPSLMTFDAPDRETCTVRRARTNTPLQALVLLNDPTYVEASRKLAERILLEGGAALPERLNFAYRTVLGRAPKPAEVTVLADIYAKQLERFNKDEATAIKLLSVGEAKRNETLNPAELATWTTLSSILLNLDETVTKG